MPYRLPRVVCAMIFLAPAFPLFASSDGDLCKGAAGLICGGIAVVQSLTPPSAIEQTRKAIWNSDIRRIEALRKGGGEAMPGKEVLAEALNAYLRTRQSQAGSDDRAVAMVRYAATREDVGDKERTEALITMVTQNLTYPAAQERKYTAAELLLDSGASAAAVDRQMLARGHASEQLRNLLRSRGAGALD